MSDRKRILVLCTGNRCRSQMAEGWLRYFAGDRAEVCSAGTVPKGLHPQAVEVMAESGVDISSQTSDHVDQYIDQRFDLVITVCNNAKEACPVFPHAGALSHHAFDDPDAPGLSDDDQAALFRRVRDEVRDWARGLVNAL
jgi:arsenate reductase (thioredoxin)